MAELFNNNHDAAIALRQDFQIEGVIGPNKKLRIFDRSDRAMRLSRGRVDELTRLDPPVSICHGAFQNVDPVVAVPVNMPRFDMAFR